MTENCLILRRFSLKVIPIWIFRHGSTSNVCVDLVQRMLLAFIPYEITWSLSEPIASFGQDARWSIRMVILLVSRWLLTLGMPLLFPGQHARDPSRIRRLRQRHETGGSVPSSSGSRGSPRPFGPSQLANVFSQRRLGRSGLSRFFRFWKLEMFLPLRPSLLKISVSPEDFYPFSLLFPLTRPVVILIK